MLHRQAVARPLEGATSEAKTLVTELEQDRRPDEFEVAIERILPGGLGLAHAEGKTIMVPLAAPGDRLRVRVDRTKGNVVFARIEEIITPSPQRVEPPCPYFGRCGGCDFQQLTYEAQLAAKIEIIRDCLRRLGGIENVPDFQITPAPNQWHYRARAQWQYDSVRRWLGYFESGSRRVCDVADCAVLVPKLQGQLESLREQVRAASIADDTRHFRAIAGDDSVSVVDDQGRDPTASARGRNLTVTEGVPKITRTVRGESYELYAGSFFQTNIDLLPQLIDAALAKADGNSAVELYSGVGLFTVPLARTFAHVIAVEGDRVAASFGTTNLARAGLRNADVVNANVADWLIKRAPRGETLDFLLLDPPRTGAESRVISGIIGLRPQRICYVSCDPATLARDLKKLIAGGYQLERIAAFDMFPQTHHIETVVHLTC